MSQTLKNKQQFLRYATVGGINTAIDFGLLFLFKSLGLPLITANILSTTTAFVFSFFANKKYTFKSHGGSLIREMILFTIVTLFGLWVLQSSVIHFSLDTISKYIHDKNLALFAAKFLATSVSLGWNYVFYSLVVFEKKPTNDES